MKQYSFRLKPGDLLKEAIEKSAVEKNVKAGVLLSVVGGLENAVLRMAGSEPQDQYVKEWNEPFEIVAGTGTISVEGCHIHIALSDREGKVIGGHLKDGCVVKYTVEIVVGILDDIRFSRSHDPDTGFDELDIKNQ